MTDPDLPEDVSQWPKDPYRLLGVARSCSDKELRQAYAALIRRFKPEHHPEQFRRIREAYDQIKAGLAWQNLGLPTEAGDGFAGSAEAATNAPSGDLAQIDACWRDGRAEEAYRLLRAQADERGGPILPDTALRLYWLLELWPELDKQYGATDWLIAVLKVNPFEQRCRELLRRVLEHRPQEGLAWSFRTWLESLDPGPLLHELLAWRWQAAVTLGRWSIPGEDLSWLAQRGLKDDVLRARLQMLALDLLIWQHSPSVCRQCEAWADELKKCQHLHNDLQADFDRLDVLLDLHRGVLALEDMAGMGSIANLVARSWYRPAMEFRAELLAFVERLLEDEEQGLGLLDRVQATAPVVMAQVFRMLENLRVLSRQQDRWNIPPPGPLVHAACAFFDEQQRAGYLDYGQFRLALLRFCQREHVEIPILFSTLAKEQTPIAVAHDLNHVYDDPPLICMALAHCLYWM